MEECVAPSGLVRLSMQALDECAGKAGSAQPTSISVVDDDHTNCSPKLHELSPDLTTKKEDTTLESKAPGAGGPDGYHRPGSTISQLVISAKDDVSEPTAYCARKRVSSKDGRPIRAEDDIALQHQAIVSDVPPQMVGRHESIDRLPDSDEARGSGKYIQELISGLLLRPEEKRIYKGSF